MVAYTSLALLGASVAVATPLMPRQQTAVVTVTVPAPTPTNTAWNAGAVNAYSIHASCNATQRSYLENGFKETMTLVHHARDHILRWGNESSIYQKYFGDAAVGEPLGWYTKFGDGDKSGVLFRCDDVDGNCQQDGWAGHWRGANATGETVICDLSYELRRPLEGMCMFGWDVANGATNFYWASDLLHRLLHIPSVGEGVVEHYSSGEYAGVLEMAQTNSSWSVRDSDTLQYFALEAYAHDIAIPGIGCPGKLTGTSSTPVAAASSMMATPTPSAAAAVSSVVASASAAVSSAVAASACTPHDDHWHCPPGVPMPSAPPS